MFKGTPELIAQRREEIIKACEKLYQTMSFKEITLKEIGNETSFSRPAIYNYFQTKEEIFLALFELEYWRWNEDLEKILEENNPLSRTQVAEKIAHSLEIHDEHLQHSLKILPGNQQRGTAKLHFCVLSVYVWHLPVRQGNGKAEDGNEGCTSKFC